MMPTCGYKKLFGRCRSVAETNIGEIILADTDGYGKPWQQSHYLCERHYHALLKTLGFQS